MQLHEKSEVRGGVLRAAALDAFVQVQHQHLDQVAKAEVTAMTMQYVYSFKDTRVLIPMHRCAHTNPHVCSIQSTGVLIPIHRCAQPIPQVCSS
jgi:hypothetical protein